MDGRNGTVKTILIDMLDEVSVKYQISQETLDRYAKLVEVAVKTEDIGCGCEGCHCGGDER